MAFACVLAVLAALLLPAVPWHGGGGGSGHDGAADDGHGATHGSQARAAQECTDPEKQTLAPSGDDGPTIDRIRAREGEKRKLIVASTRTASAGATATRTAAATPNWRASTSTWRTG